MIFNVDLTQERAVVAVSKEHRTLEFLELCGGCVHSADPVF